METSTMKEKPFTLSPSTVNLFLRDPCLFILKHFYGMTSDMNVYAIRGMAVEMGVNEKLKGATLEEASKIALDFYYSKTFDLPVDILEIEYILPQWIEKAITTLDGITGGEMPILQEELNFTINEMPFRGFLDFKYKDHTVDLKTANKIPSIISRGERKGKLSSGKEDNVRQQCIYRSVTGLKTSLLYVSTTDHLLYTVQDDEHKFYMQEVEDTIERIKKILTNGESYAINKYRPNEKLFSSFYWSDDMKIKAREIWEVSC